MLAARAPRATCTAGVRGHGYTPAETLWYGFCAAEEFGRDEMLALSA